MEDEESAGWCTLESDPGLFTGLVADLGVRDVEVNEVVTLGDDVEEWLQLSRPIYGLIFLFKHDARLAQPSRPPLAPDATPPGLFFARQTIHNACATQALLAVLLNCREAAEFRIAVGERLRRFWEFAAELDIESRGFAIGNDEHIRAVHNAFAPEKGFALEQTEARRRRARREDAFHYISYVPYGGHVYELDGLSGGPVDLGPSAAADTDTPCRLEPWLEVALQAIRQRIGRADGSEMRFSLQVVSRDPVPELQRRAQAGDTAAQQQLAPHLSKRERWERENALRRANLVPLGVRLLVALADAGAIEPLVARARERERQRIEHARRKP